MAATMGVVFLGAGMGVALWDAGVDVPLLGVGVVLFEGVTLLCIAVGVDLLTGVTGAILPATGEGVALGVECSSRLAATATLFKGA